MIVIRVAARRAFILASLTAAAAAQAQVLSTDLVYTAVEPCRVFDTRSGSGPIAANTSVAFNIVGSNSADFTSQGGHAGGCGIPGYFTPPSQTQAIPQAQAVVINLIAVSPQGPGDLRAWPSDQAKPNASVLNYAPETGLSIANAVVVPLRQNGQGGDITIEADAAGTNVVGDVVGYFSSNVKTNTALGLNSLQANTTGTFNVAFGSSALQVNSTGTDNTAVGGFSLGANTTGTGNTAVGFSTLAVLSTGSNNVAVGGNSLSMNTTGSNNVAVGDSALANNVTGSNNVAIGFGAGGNETGSNRLYIANSASDPPLIFGEFANQMVGINTSNPQATLSVHGTAQVDSLGAGTVCSSASGLLMNCSPSDARLKRDVVGLGDEMDLFATLAGLRGVAFSWDTSQPRASQLGPQREIGLIAQEVERVLPQIVSTHPDGYKSVDYAKLSAFLVEVVKSQKARLETQQDRIETQQRQLEELQRQVGELTAAPRQ